MSKKDPIPRYRFWYEYTELLAFTPWFIVIGLLAPILALVTGGNWIWLLLWIMIFPVAAVCDSSENPHTRVLHIPQELHMTQRLSYALGPIKRVKFETETEKRSDGVRKADQRIAKASEGKKFEVFLKRKLWGSGTWLISTGIYVDEIQEFIQMKSDAKDALKEFDL